jgi:predicted DNA binding CopG/RHH family protein
MMSLAQQRFTAPVEALNVILSKGRYHKDKGMSFYNNKARDVLFRLEALCRIYRTIGDKKFFDKWYKEFKQLEDLLGDMDHNEALWNEFSNYKELKTAAQSNHLEKFTVATTKLTETLQSQGWLNGVKMKSFDDGLNAQNWLTEEEDRIAYGNAICEEFDKVVDKYRNGELNMDHLEEGIHEFRRRLRWISIYAQVSNGLVQLKQVPTVPGSLAKYCTGEIVKSPFNVLPKPAKGQKTLNIQSHYFYALSWLIRHLSELKDTGLRNEAFQLLCKEARVKDKKVMQRFAETCVFDPADISTFAENVVDDFIYTDIIPERICRDIMRSVQ